MQKWCDPQQVLFLGLSKWGIEMYTEHKIMHMNLLNYPRCDWMTTIFVNRLSKLAIWMCSSTLVEVC